MNETLVVLALVIFAFIMGGLAGIETGEKWCEGHHQTQSTVSTPILP